MVEHEIDPAACRRCARRVPWMSFWGNLTLAIYKLFVGVFGGSAALVADAMHSFADVVGSTAIVVATKIGHREPDDLFPYGRGKAEFIGAVFVYTVLLLFAGGIVVSAVNAILGGDLAAPHFVTLLGAVISVFYNLVMYRYFTCVGKRNRSPAILADAFENRADAISSVACIAGILGAMFIHPVCDPLAAIMVGAIILWNCQEQLREAAGGLMDRGLSAKELSVFSRIAKRHEGVVGIRFVRSRCTGATYWIEIGVELDPGLPMVQANAIAAAVRDDVARQPDCHHAEVFVLPPEEDSEMSPKRLPSGAPAT